MRLRCCLPVALFAASLALPVAAAESGKRAITHEDAWLMKRVGAPAASPDGKWAVFLVTDPAYDAKDQSADLWLVPVDGSQPPRQLTRTKAPESGADWSPDGTRIAFSAKRDGDAVAQIYVIDLARGGEAERLTSLSSGARTPRWSPDGTKLLFVSEVYPGATDDDANKKAAKALKDRKYNARLRGFPDQVLGSLARREARPSVRAGSETRGLRA